MKKIILIIIIIFGLAALGFFFASRYLKQYHGVQKQVQDAGKDIFYCPMHPSYTSDKPGDCPICGMKLVKKENKPEGASVPQEKTQKNEKKILYYRNPMNPEVTSPVPMKDSMGMDYVAVYEEEKKGAGAGIYMSAEKQQLIGVKKEKVEKRHLTYEINTVGKVAYDPELYVAQQEYLQAMKMKDSTRDSTLSLVQQQTQALLEAAQQKLLLLGMSKDQIEKLAKQGKPQQNLYLPLDASTVWVYATIYEYELGLIKEGLSVEIDSIAFPGEVFKGKISAIKPVLDAMTRSIQIRIEVENRESKLKPDMFVNAKIQVDLGEKLAVPDSAVLDTGMRKIVYLVNEGDKLESREVTLAQRAQGYYEVKDGLKEGDIVVTSGNFLVDSESKLNSAQTYGTK